MHISILSGILAMSSGDRDGGGGGGGGGGTAGDEKIEELHTCGVHVVCTCTSWLNKKGEGKGLFGRRTWEMQVLVSRLRDRRG